MPLYALNLRERFRLHNIIETGICSYEARCLALFKKQQKVKWKEKLAQAKNLTIHWNSSSDVCKLVWTCLWVREALGKGACRWGGGERGGCCGHQRQAVAKEWNYKNYILFKCCSSMFLRIAKVNTWCMDMMGTCLRGACKCMLSDPRETWSTAMVILGLTPYFSSPFCRSSMLQEHITNLALISTERKFRSVDVKMR